MSENKYCSDLVVDIIKQYDFEYVSFNPGSTFRGLHDSLLHYGGNKNPEIITCTHENTAVGIAHGYAKALEKPMLTILHDLVGLLNGSMAVYYAYLDRVPMVIAGATGPMDITKRRPHIDWIHTALIQGNAVRDFVKWDDQPHSIGSVPDAFARAFRIANTDPMGPTYLCFDVPLLEAPLDEEVPLLDIQRLSPPTPAHADPGAIKQIVNLLTKAQNPVIIAGEMGRKKASVDKLIQLSELFAIPVIDRMNRYNFPNTHPLDLTGSDCLETADVLVCLDVRDLAGAITRQKAYSDAKSSRESLAESILPGGCKIIEMGLLDLEIRAWSMQYEKLQEADLSVLCDTSVALPGLIEQAKSRLSLDNDLVDTVGRRFNRLKQKHDILRGQWQEDAQINWDSKPMTMARLASELWEVLKHEDWVLTANSLRGWARRLWDWDQPYRHPGESLGTGTQINISLGIALAYRGTGKLVVDIQPDGDLLFTPSALWTASHHNIPLLVVMLNNRAYMNSWSHAVAMAKERGNPVDMAHIGNELNHPAPDFASLAQSFGWYAEGPIDDGSGVQAAVTRAIDFIKKENRPALIDTITQFF